MEDELSMYKQQVTEFRYDIDMYEKDMRALKMAWIKSKRQPNKEASSSSSSALFHSTTISPAPLTEPTPTSKETIQGPSPPPPPSLHERAGAGGGGVPLLVE